ncbi:MAG: hypothetical protein HZB68_02770 [Candidatus Aenigmarchaeota archaeon]|nr:hypothetical protein [Candidatus Aenigmarchaeota archaeon]
MAMELTFGLAAVNIAILLAVLYVYVQNYIAMKARFTLGLILFAFLLLLENSLSLYFNYTMMKMFSPVETELLYIKTLQTLALGFLAYVTWKG